MPNLKLISQKIRNLGIIEVEHLTIEANML